MFCTQTLVIDITRETPFLCAVHVEGKLLFSGPNMQVDLLNIVIFCDLFITPKPNRKYLFSITAGDIKEIDRYQFSILQQGESQVCAIEIDQFNWLAKKQRRCKHR